AAGLAVMLATLRGLRGDPHMGDFYVDLMRGLVFVLLPVALVVAVALVGMGVPMTFEPAAVAKTLDGPATKFEAQTIARGPVAANMEGTEVRFGPVATATWAALTTATSNGSVNGMHDSLNPVAGMVPLAMMMLNVVFSGIGAGFENMLMYVIVAVFLAGLMVGRTPEYLGKKVEAREVKLAMLAILLHPLLICAGAGLFAATGWGSRMVANPGA